MFQWIEEQYGITVHPFIFSLLSIFLVTLFYRLMNTSQNCKLNLPPSPSRLPIIGNLHQLGSFPHRALQSLARKHGPLMLLHFGQTPTLIVSSAIVAKEILKTQDNIFSNRPNLICAERLSYSYKDLAFSRYGEYWRQVRKICVLQLLSAHRVESFGAIREEEANLMIEKIRSSAQSVVDLTELLFTFTNNIICRVALGRKFDGNEGGGNFLKMVTEFMYLIGVFNVADYIPWLSFVNKFNGFNERLEKNFQNLDLFLESVIEEHIKARKNNANTGNNEAVEDFVDVLLGMEKDSSVGIPFAKDNIKALILDMFSAGTDTSSATIVWALTELMRHPDIMKELQREIREIAKEKPHITEADLGQMYYLKMVIKETLRFHLPAPLLVPHESIQNTKLLGYDVPAKTRVIINGWAIARDPKSWEEPEEFRPERFMNTSVDYKEQDYNLLPFGAGRRGCPGIIFATPNMELPLANLLYHFDWVVPDGAPDGLGIDVTESCGGTCHKKSPLLLVPTPWHLE